MRIKPPTFQDRRFDARCTLDPRCEIVAYLHLHPAAADSVEGIVDWWLPHQRYETAKSVIQHALNELVRDGVVDEFGRGDTRLYRLSRNKPNL